jgi:N-acetylmuramoyl-L-alanine amidase
MINDIDTEIERLKKPTEEPVEVIPAEEDKDVHLTVRVRQSKVDQAIVDINKLGFAAKKLDLA